MVTRGVRGEEKRGEERRGRGHQRVLFIIFIFFYSRAMNDNRQSKQPTQGPNYVVYLPHSGLQANRKKGEKERQNDNSYKTNNIVVGIEQGRGSRSRNHIQFIHSFHSFASSNFIADR
jgi:hypothetical protein